ncbi:MAG: hypothetical protein HC782_05445, partial [Gammaproteobacteria bacterium]|nr:hypothetical protein [Gammaproteobacteria bacterium]
MFAYFEKLVDPYPTEVPASPPKTFFAFMWASTKGTRAYIATMTFFTAAIGVYEAMLFAMLGKVVDWLATATPDTLLTEHRTSLFILGAVLVASPLVMWLGGFDASNPAYQFVQRNIWLQNDQFTISYHVGVDGISMLMLLLTTFIMPVAIFSSFRAHVIEE